MKLHKLSKKQLIKKLKASEKYALSCLIIRDKLSNENQNLRDYSLLQSKEFDIVSSALQSCENANMEKEKEKEKEIEHKDRLLESLIKS